MTGMACAARAETPVLHIGGQGALTQHKMGSLQDLPHVDMMAPITKFAASVPATERIADMVSMAARECYNGAWGPSYLEIPRDVLDREIDISSAIIPAPGHYRASTRSIGDPADIEKLADLLVNAERPCILLGTQVWNCRGHKEATLLCASSTSRPTSTARAAPPAARRSAPSTARDAWRSTRPTIVIVGTPFDFRMGYGRRLGRGADGADRSGLPHGRQEPRHARLVGLPARCSV
jgi:acetolactate synthase-1/2/3 large subunit